jgi:hypothetical protein
MDLVPPEAFLESYPEPMRDIAERLRMIVRRAVPDAIEAVRPGWRLIGYDVPAGRRTAYFAYVAPEPAHVHLGFEYGVLMDDPDGVLLGRGVTRRVRWLTFLPADSLDAAALEALVREAARVALMTSSERFARMLDREARQSPSEPRDRRAALHDAAGATDLGGKPL